jgi:sulfite reductase (NADPH) hemoprotein beta-component
MIETAAKVSHNELIKEANPTLAGSIGATLADPNVDRFSEDDTQFMKFHGIYQQDDRDKRKVAKEYIFMVRGRLPGGVVPAAQYLVFDRLSNDYGNKTLRITSRQGFQFHGVVKKGLGPLIKGINEALGTTLAACGDVNRNVMAPSTPATSPLVDEVLAQARKISNALLPKTPAYHQIWVENVPLNLSDADPNFVDPLYGKAYLPRKFKTAFAIPPLNDIDVLTNDVGFIAIEENGKLVGYNMCVGGGLGMSHGNKETFPRVADIVGFIKPEHVETFAKATLTVHRDFGDRTNRKHARLKYVLEEKGPDWFRAEAEQRTGIKMEPVRPFKFTKQGDLFGWHKQTNGNHFLGLFVETGRVKDTPQMQLKTALRKVVEQFGTEIRLTPSQNLIIANVASPNIEAINRVLNEHGVLVENQATPLRAASMACPALPTCGLALSESERVMPNIISRIEDTLKELGLTNEEIIIRMTGCPNGCARPYMSEIGFVGRAPNQYQIYVGGNEGCTRLNQLYKDKVKGEDILTVLRPAFARFAAERLPGERFGDFSHRVLLAELAAQAAAQPKSEAAAQPVSA